MSAALRIVLDTNVLVSALLSIESTPGRAVQCALLRHQPLISEATIAEVVEVLGRAKFSRLISIDTRTAFLEQLGEYSTIVSCKSQFTICRDPKDNKFLELAIDGNAYAIITGDEDLLALNPFRQVRVLTPGQFLDELCDQPQPPPAPPPQ